MVLQLLSGIEGPFWYHRLFGIAGPFWYRSSCLVSKVLSGNTGFFNIRGSVWYRSSCLVSQVLSGIAGSFWYLRLFGIGGPVWLAGPVRYSNVPL
jgi:hypothetical protein